MARHLGANRATITAIVQPLIEEGILVENSPIPSTRVGGRPARPIWFSPDGPSIAAMVVEHNAVHTALMSLGGNVLFFRDDAVDPAAGGSAAFLDVMQVALSEAIARAGRAPLGIGVAVSGMVDTDSGTIVKVNLAEALDGLALGPELEKRFGLPVQIDHHPRSISVGDRMFGLGRGLESFASIYTGEVLGGGYYLGGRLHRGVGGAGGEIGHTFVDANGAVCRCGRVGCWETIATVPWMREQAKALGIKKADSLTAVDLVRQSEQGDEAAKTLLHRYANNLAIGIANLQQTIAPDTFILHGDAAAGGEMMRTLIEDHARALVPPRPGSTLKVLSSNDGHLTSVSGAAALVLSHQLAVNI